MFHVNRMLPKDFKFAVSLSNTMNWRSCEEDFKFMCRLEPEGCFVLYFNSEKIGIATAISYGPVGWIGNIIVSEKYRGMGGGSLLVEKTIKYLKDKGAKTIGLYSYDNRVSFYVKHGFRFDSDFVLLRGKWVSKPWKLQTRIATVSDEHFIFKMDKKYFGGDRSKILEPILHDPGNLCFVYTCDDDLLGFIVAKVSDEMSEIGPLVCQRNERVALDLLVAALEKLKNCEVSLCIPEKEKVILEFLRRQGFKVHLVLSRMFYGSSTTSNHIYIAESLERG